MGLAVWHALHHPPQQFNRERSARMNVFAWIVLAWLTLSMFVVIANTGKVRTPSTPGAVALATAIQIAVILLFLLAVTQ